MSSTPPQQAASTDTEADREEVVILEDFLADNAYCRIIARQELDDPKSRDDPWWELIIQGYTDEWVDGETIGTVPDIDGVDSELPALMASDDETTTDD